MRRNTAAAGVVPVFAEPDYISDSGSSASVPPSPPPQPRRNQTYPVLQAVRAGAPVIPSPRGQPAAVGETMASQAVEGCADVAKPGIMLNSYMRTRTYGQIPMTRSAAGDRPVICVYCNCAFCFDKNEVPSLDPGLGHVYPAPPVPITLNLLTPPAVGPLDPGLRRPGASPPRLLVCSSKQHFKVSMGLLQQQPGGAPSLVWKCTPYCLRVLPIVVGSEDANSPDLRAIPEPPPEPWKYAGAYWNYVELGDEDMVKLKLHDDPLNLTLGPPR